MQRTEYENSIIEAIISTSPIKIDTVIDIEDLGSFPFTEEYLNKICMILESGKYSKLTTVEDNSESFDDITVFHIKDGKGNAYYTVIYDSWELIQYPKVLRIYPAIPA